MTRPPKLRFIAQQPNITYFKPRGVPLHALAEVTLGFEEMEALRLKNLEGLEQIACAKQMHISQSTFQRLLKGAQYKIAKALIEGKAIKISGGHFHLSRHR